LNLLSHSALTLGHYAEAREALEECVRLNISVDDRWGLGFGYQGLGRVAQAQGQHEDAVEMFRKGLETFTELGARRDVARALAEMGRSLFALGDTTEAEHTWYRALRIATETQGAHVALEALVGVARLKATQGALEQALELALSVMNNPACLQDTRGRASQLYAEMEAQLTSQQVEEAITRSQGKSFEVVVDEMLKQADRSR
jgi:tetratricopeptide (TPR) repeat protein